MTSVIEYLPPRICLSALPAVVISIAPPPEGMEMVDSADFDRDGIDDLLLRNTSTGQYQVWLMERLDPTNHVPRKQAINLPAVAAGWEIIAAGDLDGDDKPDLLWHHTGLRATNVWTLDGTTLTSARRIATGGASATPWRPMDVADLNNDGRDDILWERANPAPTRYSAWYKVDDNSLLSYTFGGLPYPANPAWRIHSFADFDLDGRTDALLIHTDGRRMIWRMDNKLLLKTIPLGQGALDSIITLADIDGDGDQDLIYQARTDLAQTFITRLDKAEEQLGVLL